MGLLSRKKGLKNMTHFEDTSVIKFVVILLIFYFPTVYSIPKIYRNDCKLWFSHQIPNLK
jgi:hypothetical protein